ncbi:MAG TPA: hypothetical protein VJT10_19865 [Steroidobacteraceae bacterium]|nr:hypothetical protein [Steroidobacteraceae bacterium]
MVRDFTPSSLSVTGTLAVVLSTAVVMTIRAAAILVAIFAAVFTTILAAVFPSVLAARRFVRLTGHGDRGQQRAGDEKGSKQL